MWQDDATLPRVAKCRRVSVAAGGAVGLRAESGVAGYSGLAKCGSVWSCPCCAAKIARERASELEQVLDWAVREGHTVAMLTATVKHHEGHQLDATWSAAQYAWEKITEHRFYRGDSDHEYRLKIEGETDDEYRRKVERWQARGARGNQPRRRVGWENAGRLKGKPKPERVTGWRDRWGELGWARAVEVTKGGNGWHPHLHVVFVFEGQLSGDMIRAAVDELFPIWQTALQRKGYDAQERWTNPDGSVGGALDVRVSTEETAAGLAQYFTKFVALEVTSAVNKKGRGKGLTPFQLATAAFIDGDANAYDDWVTWTQVSKGRRQLTWSGRLRELAGLSTERTDEEVAEDVIGDVDELVLPAETWRVVRDVQVELLLTTEDGGIPAAKRWLQKRRLAWIDPGLRPSPAQRPRL